MRIEQFKGGDDRNFSYYVEHDGQAVVIDPFADIEPYLEAASTSGAEIIGVLNTHTHADHTRGNKPFRERGVSRINELPVQLGDKEIQALETPGHTNDSVCFYTDGHVFTGDTLFVGKIGHARDKEQARKQYESLHKLLEELPADTVVHPGHDFGEQPTSTLAREAENNPFLQRDFDEFWELKNNWQEYKREHGIS